MSQNHAYSGHVQDGKGIKVLDLDEFNSLLTYAQKSVTKCRTKYPQFTTPTIPLLRRGIAPNAYRRSVEDMVNTGFSLQTDYIVLHCKRV